MTVDEVVNKRPNIGAGVRYGSDIECTRRAVRKLEAAGLIKTRMIHRNRRG